MMGKLYIVATPIGNLADITFRAVEVLGGVDLILAEDTRKSRILLSHYKIKKPVISFHQHSRERKVQFVIDKIKEGKDIAYITEAGTPAIADPGGELVEKLVAQLPEVKIIPSPLPPPQYGLIHHTYFQHILLSPTLWPNFPPSSEKIPLELDHRS